jgi:hypothetical protein
MTPSTTGRADPDMQADLAPGAPGNGRHVKAGAGLDEHSKAWPADDRDQEPTLHVEDVAGWREST